MSEANVTPNGLELLERIIKTLDRIQNQALDDDTYLRADLWGLRAATLEEAAAIATRAAGGYAYSIGHEIASDIRALITKGETRR